MESKKLELIRIILDAETYNDLYEELKQQSDEVGDLATKETENEKTL